MISKGWVTWGWGVFCHHCVSVGSGQAPHTWDNLEYLPSGPDSLFLPPWEWLSCAWLPEVLVPNLRKEMDQLLRAPAPLWCSGSTQHCWQQGVERAPPPGPLWALWPFMLISGGSSSPLSCQSLSPGPPLAQKRRWHLAGNGWLPFYFD